MAFEFKLPDVGEGLHEAELLKWLVKEGDVVTEDQPIMEVQTDKASVEITSPVSGRVAKLLGKPGDVLKVHSVVVVFDDGTAAAGDAAPAVSAPADVPPAPTPAPAPAPAAQPVAQFAAATAVGRALAAPATRRLARELRVDINQVRGTGPAGRVTPDDVRRFAAQPTPPPTTQTQTRDSQLAPAPLTTQTHDSQLTPAPLTTLLTTHTHDSQLTLPLQGIRKIIAERMVRSVQTAAHVTTVSEVDLTELAAFRSKAKGLAAQKGLRLSYMPFIIRAVTTALKEFPYLNASIDDEKQEIVLHKVYHIGVATDTEAGLIVPVIRNADQKSVLALAAEMADLIERGRAGKLQPNELKGSTFTISNQGSIGGLFFTPIINYPEVAILGVGRTEERPVVRDGQIVIRKMAHLALSFDHRLIDGALAARFVNRLGELLGDPTLLMLEAM